MLEEPSPSRADKQMQYVFVEVSRDKCTGGDETGFFEIVDFWFCGKRNVDGVAIPHLGDLLMSGTGAFIDFLYVKSEGRFGVEVIDADGSIYLGIRIKKASNEFDGDGDISDGANMFS